MSLFKTNVMRILEKERVKYKAHEYASDGEAVDGETVAKLLCETPEKVFKTLVAKGSSGQYLVFVVPVIKELDLKKAAKAAGEKSVSMIHVSEINGVTGYIRGGCSPIGMKKQYKTVIDSSAENLKTIIFSAGKIGYQVELSPRDLIRIIRGNFAEIIKKESEE